MLFEALRVLLRLSVVWSKQISESMEEAPEFQMDRVRPLSSGSYQNALFHVICAVRSGLSCNHLQVRPRWSVGSVVFRQ